MPETTAAAPVATPATNGVANANGKTATPATTATPPAAGQPNAEATEEIKVNGKVYKVTPAQLRALAQKGMFADEKIKSFNTLKTSAENLINTLKTPEGILQVLKDPKLGTSPKEVFRKLMMSDVIDDELKEDISKWVYDNVVVQAKKTPEELQRDKDMSELARLKKEKEQREFQEMTAKQQAQVKQLYETIRGEVIKQVVADKTFPQTEGTIRQVIEKLRVMNRKGAPVTVENITKALDLVKKDFIVHQTAILDAYKDDAEKLIAAIGEQRALAISRALVARLKSKTEPITGGNKKTEENTVREKTTDRIDKKLGKTPQGYSIINF